MFDLNHKIKTTYKTLIFIVSLISLTILTACSGGSSSSDNIDNLLGSDDSGASLLLSGRVVKGVIENANVTTYNVIDGIISNVPVKSSITDINGSYEIKTPKNQNNGSNNNTKIVSNIIYLEVTSSKNSHRPTLMTCDSINGCGVKYNNQINFGDTFPVSKDFKLRGYAIIDPDSTHTSTQLTPWSHMAVAYAESLPGGLNISNIDKANTIISEAFFFSQSVNTLNAVDLTSNNEMDLASDAELAAAIITSSLLNMGQSPDFLKIETALSTLTQQGGILLNNDSQDPEGLSLLNVARQSLNNIPNHVSDRKNIEIQLNKIYNQASNSVSDIEINVVSGSKGKIISSSHNLECSGFCEYNIAKDEIITLSAIADNGFEFTTWNGTCPGSNNQSHPVCEFNVTKATNVQAEFSQLSKTTHNLIISVAGEGLVNLDNENLNCSSNCVITVDDLTLVNLNVLPSNGYHIKTWNLDKKSICGTSLNCEVMMKEDHNLHVVFEEDAPPVIEFITLSVKANGPGIVTDSGLNLECQQTDCSFQIVKGSNVNFTASPLDNKKYEFIGWQGLCSGGGSCIRTLDSNASLTAMFNSVPKQTINIHVSEGGSVLDTALNIACNQNNTCNTDLDIDTQVNLKAQAKAGYVFDHWENACSGIADNCSILMDAEKTVSAVFSTLPKQTLTIIVSDGGSVTDTVLKIACTQGNTCNTNLEPDTSVNLKAHANKGYKFDHWENACSGNTDNCSVLMDAGKTVSAVFSPLPKQNLIINVSEGGIVSDSALNISCAQGITCNTSLDFDTLVNLKAQAHDGYVFDHWENDCSGISNNCSVLMNSQQSVTAVFQTIPKQTLTIIVSQGGSVSESGLGITCTQGNTCSTELDFDTQTSLKTQANAGYVFDHWENDCTNFDNICSLTIKSDHTVKAVFKALTSSTSVRWTPPTERESGADLSLTEIKKYIIYYGVESGVYIDAIEVGFSTDSNGVPTTLLIEGLETGIVYYFAGMTVDTDNISSKLSNEISRLIE